MDVSEAYVGFPVLPAWLFCFGPLGKQSGGPSPNPDWWLGELRNRFGPRLGTYGPKMLWWCWGCGGPTPEEGEEDEKCSERMTTRSGKTFAVYTEGQSKRNQPTISRIIVGFAVLGPFWFIFARFSRPCSSLLSFCFINHQPPPSQPPFLNCHWSVQ